MPKEKGPCLWEITRGVTCGKQSVTQVRMRDSGIGFAYVPVCDDHRAEYNQKATRLRKTH